jgi:arylformamidase
MTRASSTAEQKRAGRQRRPARASADGWIDVSVTIRNGMLHWPGDPDVRVERVQDIAAGDVATISRLSLGAHTGTHVDAPVHFVPGGPGIDRMPVDATFGAARVIRIRHPSVVLVRELERHAIRRGERILLRTRNSARAWSAAEFAPDFVYLSTEAAEWLAARGVRTIGIDYLSVGGYRAENGVVVHRALLHAGVCIIEGLDLSRVPEGPCELICLPLRVQDGDGGPARAIVRPLGRKVPGRGRAATRARNQRSRPARRRARALGA